MAVVMSSEAMDAPPRVSSFLQHEIHQHHLSASDNNSTVGGSVSDHTCLDASHRAALFACLQFLIKSKHSQKNDSTSLEAILATFIPSLLSALVLLLVFIIIKRPFRRIYSPRTYIDVIPEK